VIFFTLVLLVGVDASGGGEGGKGLEGVEEGGDTDDPEPLGEETCGEGGPANEIEHDDEGEGVNGVEEGKEEWVMRDERRKRQVKKKTGKRIRRLQVEIIEPPTRRPLNTAGHKIVRSVSLCA
jgi:hypothetical protein